MRLYAGHALDRLDDDVKAKVWRLADSIRDAQSGDRCLVSVGVEQDEFAGRFGDVVDVSDDGDERAICKVRLDNEEHDFPRWRLKTARGLWRTNAVEFQGVGFVYERLSRVNRLRARRELRAGLTGNGAPGIATHHQGGRRAAPGLW